MNQVYFKDENYDPVTEVIVKFIQGWLLSSIFDWEFLKEQISRAQNYWWVKSCHWWSFLQIDAQKCSQFNFK